MAGSLRYSRGCLNRGLSCWGTFVLVSFNSWPQEELQYVEEWEEGRNKTSAIG
jgi:hypothetical protein